MDNNFLDIKSKKRFIEKKYTQQLKKIVNKRIPGTSRNLGNSTTFGSDLNKLGKQMFGSKFQGVFTADEVNKLRKGQNGYYIYNLGHSDEPGSHWLGIAKYCEKQDKKKTEKKCNCNNIMIYDSYGRKTEDILPNLTKIGGLRLIDTQNDAEQGIFEKNCGQRSLVFLKIFDKYGPKNARLI